MIECDNEINSISSILPMYRKDKANAVLKLTCGGFCVCIKKFPNKQVRNEISIEIRLREDI